MGSCATSLPLDRRRAHFMTYGILMTFTILTYLTDSKGEELHV